MKMLVLAVMVFIGSVSQAQSVSKKLASLNIEAAVNAVSPIAQTGKTEYQVTPGLSIKMALHELAVKHLGMDSTDFENGWISSDDTENDVWEGDSRHFGETDMKTASSYISTADEFIYDEMTDAEKSSFLSLVKNAKQKFKLLRRTGVQFGVAPVGAVQCGFTYAALVIYDQYSGKIYVVAMEGTGC